DIARLMVNPLPVEKTANLNSGRTGVLLTSGDFFDGEFKAIENGRVKMSSVLFGLRTFNLSNEVSVVVLRDIAAPRSQFEIRTRDGSVLQAKSIAVQQDNLYIVDVALGGFRIPLADLMELKR